MVCFKHFHLELAVTASQLLLTVSSEEDFLPQRGHGRWDLLVTPVLHGRVSHAHLLVDLGHDAQKVIPRIVSGKKQSKVDFFLFHVCVLY